MRMLYTMCAVLALAMSPAYAEQIPNTTTGKTGDSTVPLCMSAPGSAGVAGRAVSCPNVGAIHQVTVTCGVSTTLLLAAGSATSFLYFKVPIGTTGTVWVDWSGNAAVAASPSEGFIAGNWKLWSSRTGYLPTAQLNCIAPAGNTAVTVQYQ